MKRIFNLTLLLVILFCSFVKISSAQLIAEFEIQPINTACPAINRFTDKSEGNPVKWYWDFGDGSFSTEQNATHSYSRGGIYLIKLSIEDNKTSRDTTIKIININIPTPVFLFAPVDTNCSSIKVMFVNNSYGANTFEWDYGDGFNFNGEVPPPHNYKAPGEYNISLIAGKSTSCALVSTQLLRLGAPAAIQPSSKPSSLIANYECTDEDGWTNYYYDNNTPAYFSDDTLLLSIMKNGNDIGNVNNPNFRLKVATTAGAGSNKAILLTNPLITNTTGFWVMNRYWEVNTVKQPKTPVGIRFNFNTQDLNDVNGSYPTHNLAFKDLLFYKCIDGNPDPTTNLNGASRIISIVNGNTVDTTHWVYKDLLNGKHRAEFLVSSFSGGGGGATGDKKTLPVKLISFTAENIGKNNIYFKWQTGSEINTGKFEIERSIDGRIFQSIANVKGKGNAALGQTYNYNHLEMVMEETVYYRLRIMDNDGKSEISKTIPISLGSYKNAIKIYPNPVNNGFAKIILPKFYTGNILIWLYDAKGIIIKEVNKNLQGENSVYLNFSNIAAGLYKIRVYGKDQEIGTQNLVIL